MLIDLEKLSEVIPESKQSTVCIAGAGIAGLVLADALAKCGVDVHLLEAGGRKDEERSQSIYDACMAARNHTGTKEGRFRLFGGSSTRWGGQILPYTEEIFSPPDALAGPQWQLKSDALEPFYKRVEEILGVNNLPFDTGLLKSLRKRVPGELHLNPCVDLRFSKWAPFSRRNLAQTLGKIAIESSRITVFLHANVTECLLSPDGSRIEGFQVKDYDGKTYRFVAKHYVMAMGTIETSRLLLASRSVCPKGVGNCRDQVGRSFHDHVGAPVATISGVAQKQLLSWMGPFYSSGTTHTGRFEAARRLRKRLGLPSIMAHLTIEEPEDSGMTATRELLRSLQRGEASRFLLDNYTALPSACFDAIRLAYEARVNRRRAISAKARVTMRVESEQIASSGNRIRLAKRDNDSLGVARAVIDWRVSDEEISSMRRYAGFLQKELTRLGVNRIDWLPDAVQLNSDKFPDVRDTNHPMGGTIIGSHAESSVVNHNLQVHGISNLFVASCSTFPSGGSSNPTFTMMALTLRLSAYLKNRVSQNVNFA